MAQLALGVVGGVVGFVASGFNPYGAAIGFSVGMSIGGVLAGGVSVPGNTLGDIATQTSKEGVARPIIWGRVRPIAGNLIACSEPKKVTTESSAGGKGGGGATTTSESVYRTYAIRVCEGPITRFVRVWRNNELVYDGRLINEGETVATTATTPLIGTFVATDAVNTQWGNENNAEFLKNARLYLGNWDQMPDSALEGIFGAGNVPAHRGTAYMVMDNELLNDTGGAVPQWTFEVERCEGVILTTKPYAIVDYESAGSDGVISVKERPPMFDLINVSSSGLNSVSGTLKNVLIKTEKLTDSNSSDGLSIFSGYLNYDPAVPAVIYSYTINQESINSAGMSLSSGDLSAKLIKYTYWPAENTKSNGLSITSGSMS